MTRKDVALALTISVAALLLYVGVKQVLGGHWDWVTFVIWVRCCLGSAWCTQNRS